MRGSGVGSTARVGGGEVVQGAGGTSEVVVVEVVVVGIVVEVVVVGIVVEVVVVGIVVDQLVDIGPIPAALTADTWKS
jgi:hypothetical protein